MPQRERWPNLASRVLGLCLRRLSEDWQARWQHPVLLVESFVDESRYRGTSYRACGFHALGLTKGSGRNQRRDISFAEDRCRITKNGGAQVIASLRNLAIGIYDLQKEQGRTRASSLTSWMRQMTPGRALQLLSR